jgi:hypothetical protein
MRYDQRMMPKGRLGQITIGGVEYEVFTTGDPKWLLFSPMMLTGVSSAIHIPVRRSDLKPGWWKRLH